MLQLSGYVFSSATSSVPHFAVFIGANGSFTSAAANCFYLNFIVVIVTNPKFILPWVLEKFTVKFTMSNVDGYTIYMHMHRLP